MNKYMGEHEFYYEKYLIKNYNSKVVLSMLKLMNGNRKCSFTIAQLSKLSGESKKAVKSAVYKVIDEYVINNIKVDFVPAEYSVNELFIVQFPLRMENFSFLYEFEIDELLSLDDSEIKVFLALFGLMKNSIDFKSNKTKQLSIGRDTISLYSGVKNLNSLTKTISSLEEKKWIKIIEKGNNLKQKNSKYKIIKAYKVR